MLCKCSGKYIDILFYFKNNILACFIYDVLLFYFKFFVVPLSSMLKRGHEALKPVYRHLLKVSL